LALSNGELSYDRRVVHNECLPSEGVVVPSKSSGGSRGRSAITGRFVKQSTVKKNPKTTINESTKGSKTTKK
jgi:hypothetical protein